MSEPPSAAEHDEDVDDPASRAMASLVKRSLSAEPAAEGGRVLRGVQRKLRQRSRGKFYGDGWSTTNARMSHVLIAVLMLVLMGIAYLALGPVVISPG